MHFNQGRLPVAFVLSAPGSKEVESKLPIAGATGDNLEDALAHLVRARPDVFNSRDRYDYRITNAFAKPLAKALGDKRTEATRAEILLAENTGRLVRDLQGTQLVVLCGRKAAHLRDALPEAELFLAECSHLGNRGLNMAHRLDAKSSALTSEVRKAKRIEEWVTGLLVQISEFKFRRE